MILLAQCYRSANWSTFILLLVNIVSIIVFFFIANKSNSQTSATQCNCRLIQEHNMANGKTKNRIALIIDWFSKWRMLCLSVFLFTLFIIDLPRINITSVPSQLLALQFLQYPFSQWLFMVFFTFQILTRASKLNKIKMMLNVISILGYLLLQTLYIYDASSAYFWQYQSAIIYGNKWAVYVKVFLVAIWQFFIYNALLIMLLQKLQHNSYLKSQMQEKMEEQQTSQFGHIDCIKQTISNEYQRKEINNKTEHKCRVCGIKLALILGLIIMPIACYISYNVWLKKSFISFSNNHMPQHQQSSIKSHKYSISKGNINHIQAFGKRKFLHYLDSQAIYALENSHTQPKTVQNQDSWCEASTDGYNLYWSAYSIASGYLLSLFLAHVLQPFHYTHPHGGKSSGLSHLDYQSLCSSSSNTQTSNSRDQKKKMYLMLLAGFFIASCRWSVENFIL